MMSPGSGSIVPVGVTSQIVGKFKNLDECKSAAVQPFAAGAIADASLSRSVYWYCAYTGAT
jgi:hypothetical protein